MAHKLKKIEAWSCSIDDIFTFIKEKGLSKELGEWLISHGAKNLTK